ncbi:hypothetical protein A0H81_13835 [Grifola frondosa]|uniref:Uncharacterized protein n=1 Tax=Grifola frondosa TaxID=5627 RepID=A0A1C7LTX8_GRIFR|nr:hypothetical protein A0H81_13835 [Grifola frondosa]
MKQSDLPKNFVPPPCGDVYVDVARASSVGTSLKPQSEPAAGCLQGLAWHVWYGKYGRGQRTWRVGEREAEGEEPRTPVMLLAGATLLRKFGSLFGHKGGDDLRLSGGTIKRGSVFSSFSPRPSVEVEGGEDKDGEQFPTEDEKAAQ